MLNKDSVLAGLASSFVGNWVLPFSPKMSEKPAKRCMAMTRFFWLRFWCSLWRASFSSCLQLYHDLVLFWQKASCQVSPCTHRATAKIITCLTVFYDQSCSATHQLHHTSASKMKIHTSHAGYRADPSCKGSRLQKIWNGMVCRFEVNDTVSSAQQHT